MVFGENKVFLECFLSLAFAEDAIPREADDSGSHQNLSLHLLHFFLFAITPKAKLSIDHKNSKNHIVFSLSV